eukprot:Em0024g184a
MMTLTRLATFVVVFLRSADCQTFTTTTPSSCYFSLTDFDYPSDCPAYTPVASIQTLATSSCSKLCSSRCIDPLLAYMEACHISTSVSNALKGWCGTSEGNGQLCCTLGTTLSGALADLGFFTFCDNALTCNIATTRSQCTSVYDSYGCCLANLIDVVPQLTFDWTACGFSQPDTCFYDPWPLPISKELLIGLVAGVGGGLLLLCVVCCVVCICCCMFGVCAGSRRRKVVMGTKTGNSDNAEVEYQQFP